jgi:hypothetical protein
MTQDHRSYPPVGERRDNLDRRNADRRAHDRYTPVGTPGNRSDRRQGERRRSTH